MDRDNLLRTLSKALASRVSNDVLLVGVDGIDGAGKTTLADELVPFLKELGVDVKRASIDGFHNPREYRVRQGNLSPEGYYQDSFDYDFLTNNFFGPIKSDKLPLELPKAKFDWKSDSEVGEEFVHIEPGTVILFEGVFLFRPQLRDYWDFKIFVDIPFELSLERGLKRDSHLLGGGKQTREKYLKRYIPGQKLYFSDCDPISFADLVIDNSSPQSPELLKGDLVEYES